MGQRNQFVMTARGEIGTIEGPKENETKYGKFMKANFLPWCGSFVNFCAAQVDLKIPNCVQPLQARRRLKSKAAFKRPQLQCLKWAI